MLFSSLFTFQYVVVCVILILGQTAAVVIFYKFPHVVSNNELLFKMMLRVNSGIFGQIAKFGQRPCLVHILNIGIKNKLTKQTVKILMRRLIRSHLIWIYTVCKCVSELTWCPKLPNLTLI